MKYNKPYLKHILDEIEFLENRTKNIEFEELNKDEVLKRAVLRSLEVIGEAAKNLSNEFKDGHKEVNWKRLTGLRDIIIHKYFGVEWRIIWDVLKNMIPEIKIKIQNIFRFYKGRVMKKFVFIIPGIILFVGILNSCSKKD